MVYIMASHYYAYILLQAKLIVCMMHAETIWSWSAVPCQMLMRSRFSCCKTCYSTCAAAADDNWYSNDEGKEDKAGNGNANYLTNSEICIGDKRTCEYMHKSSKQKCASRHTNSTRLHVIHTASASEVFHNHNTYCIEQQQSYWVYRKHSC